MSPEHGSHDEAEQLGSFPEVPQFGPRGEIPPPRVEGLTYTISNGLTREFLTPDPFVHRSAVENPYPAPVAGRRRDADWPKRLGNPVWVTITPFWERVDDHGATVRVGPGDAFDVAVTTEVGFTETESKVLAKGAGMSVNAWIARLDASAGENFGYSLARTRKQATTYTRRFGNADEKRRDRLIALWRPGVTVRRLQLDDVYISEERYFQLMPSFVAPNLWELWRTTVEVSSYLSKQYEYSDFYADHP